MPITPQASEAKIAASIGNDFSSKNRRIWRETLSRIAAQDPAKLRRIAERVYAMAEAGDLGAIREIADRLDGKPMQSVEMEVRNPGAEMALDELNSTLDFVLMQIRKLKQEQKQGEAA